MQEIRVESAASRHQPGLARLFESDGHACHCRFWHFDGDARQWLARCAERPEENASEMRDALRSGSAEMQGMVAETADGELVGWMKLAPAALLGKLYGQRLYKGLACLERDRQGILTVGCMLVREDFRHRGVARALLAGAVEAAAGWGALALEAFPRGDADAADAALMMGPVKLFLNAGFEIVHGFAPYPVLRLELARAGRAP